MRNTYNIFRDETEFKDLWIGYTLTVLGGWFATIAVNLYVWNAYESAILSSVSLAINMVPTVFLGPILGRYIDKFDKKTLAILMSILNSIILFLPMVWPNIYTVCLFNFLNGVILCIRYPWLNSYLPMLVTEEHLIDANAAISFSKTCGQLIMPFISGFLFAAASSAILFFLNFLFLILAIVSFLHLPRLKHDGYNNTAKNCITILSQVQYIVCDKKISCVALVMMVMLFVDGGMNLFLIMAAKSILNMPDSYYGMLTTIKGLGMTLAGLGAAKWLLKFKISNIRLLFYIGFAKIGLIFFLGHINYSAFFAVVVFFEAYLWTSMTILENLTMQSILLPQHRASVFAVYGSLCWLSSSVGTLVFGYLAENMLLPATVTIETIMAFAMIGAVYCYKMNRFE